MRKRIWALINQLLDAPASPVLDADDCYVPVQVGGGEGAEMQLVTLRDMANGQMGGVFWWDTYTNPAAADTDFFVAAATATTAADRTWTVGGSPALLASALPGGFARRVTITSTANAAFTSVVMTIVGTDANDNAITGTITTTAGGNTTDSSTHAFKTVTSITLPAQGGAGATFQIGLGAGLGLTKALRAREGVNVVLREHAAGSLVTNGVFALPASVLPYGLYTPNSAPDASRDYAIFYEVASS
jgi:hypothetical protein